MITGLCKADVATYGPHVAFDCHVVVLCLQWGRPVQSKCIVHTSLYYTVAALHSRECDHLFKFDKFLVSETHLSSCVPVRRSPREGFQLGVFFHVLVFACLSLLGGEAKRRRTYTSVHI